MSETLIERLRTYAQWTREAHESGPSHPKSIAIDDVDPDMLDEAADALTVAQARIERLERENARLEQLLQIEIDRSNAEFERSVLFPDQEGDGRAVPDGLSSLRDQAPSDHLDPAGVHPSRCVQCGAPILSDDPVDGQHCLDCIWVDERGVIDAALSPDRQTSEGEEQ